MPGFLLRGTQAWLWHWRYVLPYTYHISCTSAFIHYQAPFLLEFRPISRCFPQHQATVETSTPAKMCRDTCFSKKESVSSAAFLFYLENCPLANMVDRLPLISVGEATETGARVCSKLTKLEKHKIQYTLKDSFVRLVTKTQVHRLCQSSYSETRRKYAGKL